MADGGADFLLLIGEVRFGDAEIHFGERDVRLGLRAEDWNLDVDAGVEIVAFEFLKELCVVVEPCEQAVGGDELKRGVVAALFAGEAELFGADVRNVGLDRSVILHSKSDEVCAFLLSFTW